MYLAGDIGGTKTVLALFADGHRRCEHRYASGDFSAFDEVLARFLDDARTIADAGIEAACFGVAGVISDQHVNVTNLPWEIDAAQLSTRFGIPAVQLVNDLVAAGHGIAALEEDDCVTLQAGDVRTDATRLVIGAGTGLGLAHLLCIDGRIHARASEGGHTGFAPADALQGRLWQALRREFGRVEMEHVVSGAGLERIYRFLVEDQGTDSSADDVALEGVQDSAKAIATAALEGEHPLADAALDLFVSCYGAAVGDHALTCLARGGVFISGGIAPKILPRLQQGGFIAAFGAKGEFSALARSLPVHVITNERVGLLGAAHCARVMAEQGGRDDGRE